MDEKVPLSKISIAPIVRQSQSLQLCAVMTINNLLQACTEDETYENESATEALMLCGGNLLRLKKDAQPMATAAELNRIADELILRETALLQDNATSNEISQDNTYPSHWQVISSHHRTPLFGNYSFEVRQHVFVSFTKI